MNPSRSYRVRVPASTSNLGPGFDLVGLALSLELDVTAHCSDPASDPSEWRSEWPPQWPLENDLLGLAFHRARAHCEPGTTKPGLTEPGATKPGAHSDERVRFEVRTQIPIARGLGSSGAAIAAGLLLGSASSPRPATRTELLALAIELEGHPDNVTPALFGGLCISLLPSPAEGTAPVVVASELHPDLAFAVAWPSARLATVDARALLPDSVPFADAVENPRRLALLLEGLRTANPELLTLGGVDRLHVPYRLPKVPGGSEALAAARAQGAWLATLSGSGTALFAISSKDRIDAVAEAMGAALLARERGATARVVTPVLRPPEVTTLGPGQA